MFPHDDYDSNVFLTINKFERELSAYFQVLEIFSSLPAAAAMEKVVPETLIHFCGRINEKIINFELFLMANSEGDENEKT